MGYAPEEPRLRDRSFPTGITEDDLKALPLDDLKLRVSYVYLMQAGDPRFLLKTSEMTPILNDLKRRGDEATPLLIDIMEKNHNTSLEYLIPLVISKVGTLKMEPYLEYLRRMITSRPDEINATLNEVALKIFLEHGTEDDVEMVQDLARKRPFLAPSVERAFEFERWRTPVSDDPATVSGSPSVAQPPTPKQAPETKPAPTVRSDEQTSSTSWPVVAVSILAAVGLLWLLLKGRK